MYVCMYVYIYIYRYIDIHTHVYTDRYDLLGRDHLGDRGVPAAQLRRLRAQSCII